jgi:hypothetical protein
LARYGGLVGQPAAGEFLKEQIFAPGAMADWNERVHLATGHPLDPIHFVRQFVTDSTRKGIKDGTNGQVL